MLKHEDNPQTQPPPAAQVRVTPEELAAAITALQIRKEGQSGTIAIGDAVEELGLDVTPEEVLAEVQARQRAMPSRKRLLRGRRFVLALGLAGVLLGAVIEGHSLLQMRGGQAASSHAAGSSLTLDQIPSEQQVYVDSHGLKQIIEGAPETKVLVYSASEPTRWGLIKHDGKAYVQAYTFKTTEQGLRNRSVKLFSSEHPDDSGFDAGTVFEDNRMHDDVQVTLPAQALQYQDSQQVDGISKVLIKGVKPDNHVWDGF